MYIKKIKPEPVASPLQVEELHRLFGNAHRAKKKLSLTYVLLKLDTDRESGVPISASVLKKCFLAKPRKMTMVEFVTAKNWVLRRFYE